MAVILDFGDHWNVFVALSMAGRPKGRRGGCLPIKEPVMPAHDGSAVAARETRHEPERGSPRAGRGAKDWDDVRVFLAIARGGSMRAAGRALGLSQPTIARRLATFEAGFGGQPVFDRLPEGVRLTAAGEQLLATAEDAEQAMLTLERRRAAASPVLRGTVRVAT